MAKQGADRGAAIDAAVAAMEAANIYVVFNDDRSDFTVKGSKSLGNIPRVRDIFARGFDGREVRFLLLRAHYRSPLTFSWKLLDEARTAVNRWATSRRRLRQEMDAAPESSPKSAGKLAPAVAAAKTAFREAMDNDFNTPVAIAAAFDLISAINTALGASPLPPKAELESAREMLDSFEFTLGLAFDDTDGAADALSDEEQAWLAEREAARESRDFAASDRLRNRLASRGIAVEDTAGGQRWHRDEAANLVANLLPGKKGAVVAEWSQQLWDAEFRLAATDAEHHAMLRATLDKLAADGKAELVDKDGALRVKKKKA
ncbi:MAG: DALR domain-containing protein [Planctomycetota bacterium]